MGRRELQSALVSQGTPGFDRIELLHKQREFIEAFWEKDYLLYAGGYGSGKTLVGCYAGLLLSLLCPGNFGLIGREHASDLRDSTQRIFFEMLPAEFMLKWKPTEGHLWLTNGSEILFRHLDEATGLKSLNLGWAYIDEITDTSETVFRMLQSRLRLPVALPERRLLATDGWLASKVARNGRHARRLFATTNTDAPGHWVHRAWFGPPPPAGIGLPPEKRFAIASTSRDNSYLPSEYLADMDASFDPKYHERYVQGKWVDIGRDRTYHQFEREVHVKRCPVDKFLPIIQAWDFNINPMASVVLQRAGFEVRVVDEIVIHTSNTPEVCDEFLRRYESVLRGGNCPGLWVYGDATARTRGATAGKSDYAVMAQKYGRLPRVAFRVPRGNPPEIDRVAAVNAKLRSHDGKIGIVVDPKCLNLITDLEMVHYKAGARAIDKPSGAKIEKGEEALLSHISDALGYYIVAEFPLRRPGAGLRHYNAPI